VAGGNWEWGVQKGPCRLVTLVGLADVQGCMWSGGSHAMSLHGGWVGWCPVICLGFHVLWVVAL